MKKFLFASLLCLSSAAHAGFLTGVVVGSMMSGSSKSQSRPSAPVSVKASDPTHSTVSCKKSVYGTNLCETNIEHEWENTGKCYHEFGEGPGFFYGKTFHGQCSVLISALPVDKFAQEAGFKKVYNQSVFVQSGQEFMVLEVGN